MFRDPKFARSGPKGRSLEKCIFKDFYIFFIFTPLTEFEHNFAKKASGSSRAIDSMVARIFFLPLVAIARLFSKNLGFCTPAVLLCFGLGFHASVKEVVFYFRLHNEASIGF